MSFLPRFGSVDVSIPAGQSLMIGSLGAGQARVSYGTTSGQLLPVYTLNSVVTGGTLLLGPFANGQAVRIEASPACDLEYVVGTQPVLTQNVGTAVNALTAKAGGGQSGATALNYGINRVTTVGTAADSLLLPPALPGQQVTMIQAAAANAANVFPATGEAINALSANTALSVAANKVITFFCAVAGTWNSLLTA